MQQAFGKRWLSATMGYLVVLITVTSSATISNGFAGYFKLFVDLPDWFVLSALLLTLGLIACWGITESVTLAAAITLVEIGGLVLVFAAVNAVLLVIKQQGDAQYHSFRVPVPVAGFLCCPAFVIHELSLIRD